MGGASVGNEGMPALLSHTASACTALVSYVPRSLLLSAAWKAIAYCCCGSSMYVALSRRTAVKLAA